MGLWQMLIAAFCGKPQKQVAEEEACRRERELLQEGLWVKALEMNVLFVFPATAERFDAWYSIAREYVRSADEAFESGFMGRLINLLHEMAAQLNDDAWCKTASVTLAGARCYSGGSYIHASIRAAARVSDQQSRAQCMREIAGRLQNPYCAMDAAGAEMAVLYPYLTPDERQVVHGKLLLSQHRQQGEARIAQVTGEPVTYSATNYREAMKYGENFRFFAREFKDGYPEEWSTLILEHWRQCFEGDGVCLEIMGMCSDEQLQLLSERLDEEIRAKPWWEDLRLWRIALAEERRRRS